MRKPAILALSAAATMALTTLAGAAQAQARTGAASATASSSASTVRYAWLKGCSKKDDYFPCGSWHLALGNGRDSVFKDAQVFPRTAKGKIDKGSFAPLSVSGDGRQVSYWRKKDGLLVVRDVTTNKVRVLPRAVSKLPKGLGMGDLATSLSRDGGLLTIDYYDSDDKIPSLIVNVRTGKVRTIPADSAVVGFSPDGKHVLVSRGTAENTSRFSVYDQDGRRTNTQVVPQVVANNSPMALADDGSSVAVLITTSSGGQRLRVYDLSADTVGDAVDVRVPKNESAKRLEWTSDGGLKLWETLDSVKTGETYRVVVHGLDTGTGATTKLDSFTVKSSLWTWCLPGE
ncbi:hypothetical protein [Microbispora siamensis]|uniref:WD40 repeat domain-containing protein n=1 Tax=Microbispora siamensis TaxID=564413 RepID=A0ABQ4GM79_9ACTN|nr:hypothetical protein [Microbispora siamensis]GIH62526.1 hypothetical protein Msi02_33430 [Microbispora siamensis]